MGLLGSGPIWDTHTHTLSWACHLTQDLACTEAASLSITHTHTGVHVFCHRHIFSEHVHPHTQRFPGHVIHTHVFCHRYMFPGHVHPHRFCPALRGLPYASLTSAPGQRTNAPCSAAMVQKTSHAMNLCPPPQQQKMAQLPRLGLIGLLWLAAVAGLQLIQHIHHTQAIQAARPLLHLGLRPAQHPSRLRRRVQGRGQTARSLATEPMLYQRLCSSS